jgi:hypothetical protein
MYLFYSANLLILLVRSGVNEGTTPADTNKSSSSSSTLTLEDFNRLQELIAEKFNTLQKDLDKGLKKISMQVKLVSQQNSDVSFPLPLFILFSNFLAFSLSSLSHFAFSLSSLSHRPRFLRFPRFPRFLTFLLSSLSSFPRYSSLFLAFLAIASFSCHC